MIDNFNLNLARYIKSNFNHKFISGKTYIPVSGKVFDEKELFNGIQAVLQGWWTEGEYSQKFSKAFGKLFNTKYITLVNSGSSANLLAVASLTAEIFGTRKLRPGDEFITTALSFPTTVNPGLLYGLKPVFADINLSTLNIDVDQIEKAINKKTKLIMVAHTLGIPFDLEKLLYLKKKYHLWLIEDCCDALGSKWSDRLVGTFGDIATFSFYPAHQITMGEGGAVITNNSIIYKTIRQFRDWGRDCWCDTGKDDTCHKRFKWKLGDLPYGYDHKYSYSQIGYNLKLTDFQAAIGLAQLEKLPGFIKIRKKNYRFLMKLFGKFPGYFSLPDPNSKSDPCWFGFPIIVKTTAPFTRDDLIIYFESKMIGTRPIFAGNILRHPAYKHLKYKKISELKNCDEILNHGLWIGVYPGIDRIRLNYIKDRITEFINLYR